MCTRSGCLHPTATYWWLFIQMLLTCSSKRPVFRACTRLKWIHVTMINFKPSCIIEIIDLNNIMLWAGLKLQLWNEVRTRSNGRKLKIICVSIKERILPVYQRGGFWIIILEIYQKHWQNPHLSLSYPMKVAQSSIIGYLSNLYKINYIRYEMRMTSVCQS